MAVKICVISVFLVTGMSLATLPALGAEPTEDMRVTARVLASQEAPVAKRDLKGFCAATYGSPDYAGYSARACQLWVKNNMKKPEDCTEVNIQQEIRKDTDRCLAMSDEDFDKQIVAQRKARAEFIAKMKEEGVDGEKLLQHELARRDTDWTGAQYCEYCKGGVETLKSILTGNSVKMSDAVRASLQRDLVAFEKEATICCSDLDQCKRAFEAPAEKKK